MKLLVVEILADVLRDSKFSSEKIEEQRAIMLRKIEEVEKDYRWSVLDNLHKAAYQGTSFGLSPIGREESIR